MNIRSIIQTIKDAPRNIKYGIKNLIKWFPVIWQDRDWDHYFLYVILHHKLKYMEKVFLSDDCHVMSAKQTAAQIKICINLLDRLIEDEYHENASIDYYKKWGKPKFNWIEIPDNENGCSMLEITHKNVRTNKDRKQEKKEFHRICDHERNMKKQDLHYLFNYIAKHIQGWWD